MSVTAPETQTGNPARTAEHLWTSVSQAHLLPALAHGSLASGVRTVRHLQWAAVRPSNPSRCLPTMPSGAPVSALFPSPPSWDLFRESCVSSVPAGRETHTKR